MSSSKAHYGRLVTDISGILEQARRAVARSTNGILAATYWEVGRRIVEYEQGGRAKAAYGKKLVARLAVDLTARHGRGFSRRNVEQMRAFYLGWEIAQTPSAQLEVRAIMPAAPGRRGGGCRHAPSGESGMMPVPVSAPARRGFALPEAFPLSWSQYVRLMAVENPQARAFYEAEALRGGWSVRQLDRQVSTRVFERAVRSRKPHALPARSRTAAIEDAPPARAELRDPYLLEFLDLKDEYCETDLENAIIRHLEGFLLEMGTGFTFVARQKRIRIGDEWYRMDLLLYHRRLKCLVVMDLKIGKFTHADAGQINLYLNYAREHLTEPGENDPIGLVLCSAKNDAVVHYAMGGIKANVFASHYLTALPDETTLRNEVLATQRAIEARWKEAKTDD